jgi:uncharacterized membrane protein YeaQ/YmgE (transglycosylase-associated protein family)
MKKAVYIILWIILGLVLSFIAHAIIEILYLRWANNNNISVHWILNGNCALPLWLIIALPILGIIFGLFCGFVAWRKIYAEHTRDVNSEFFEKH